MLLEARECPLLKHRTDEEWAHVPDYIRARVLSGTYPAERLKRWERVVDDLLAFLLLKVDQEWGDTYTSFHAALAFLDEEVHEYRDVVYGMPNSTKGHADPDDVAAAISELRDVAAVALMTQFHLTDFQALEGDDR